MPGNGQIWKRKWLFCKTSKNYITLTISNFHLLCAYQLLIGQRTILDGAVDWVDVRNLPVPRVDLAVVEGPDSHDNADIVVTLPVRIGGVRRHPREVIGGEGRRKRDGMGLKSNLTDWISQSKFTRMVKRWCLGCVNLPLRTEPGRTRHHAT